jgi:hypothetical protein
MAPPGATLLNLACYARHNANFVLVIERHAPDTNRGPRIGTLAF